jgi:hypothetical protein
MSRTVLSLWLLGAALYAAGTLLLVQPFGEASANATPPEVTLGVKPSNVTIRAKQATKAEAPAPEAQTPPKQADAAPSAAPKPQYRDELVQVAGYTAIARAQPTASAHVLTGYPVGRPFRVIAREAGFVRVQDLESGQFGWIAEASLAPFTGGYRPTHVPVLVAVQEPPQQPPQREAIVAAAPTAAPTKVAAVQPLTLSDSPVSPVSQVSTGPIVKQPEEQPQRVAARHTDNLAAIMQRAFSAY